MYDGLLGLVGPFGTEWFFGTVGVVIYYWVTTELPWVWKPFAVADVVFLALFWWAYTRLRARAR